MKLYRAQLSLFLSKKELYLLLGSLLLFLIYILFSSGYYLDYNYQVVYRSELFFQYLEESISFMKFSIIIFGIYISILSRKLHYLDGLLLSRGTRLKVILSRIAVLVSTMSIIVSILYILFLTVGSFLTPIMMTYDYLKLFLSLQVFGMYYLFISYLMILLVKAPYSPIFVLLFYFIGTVFSPYYAIYEDITNMEKVLNFFVNDLIIFQNRTIVPMYGNGHVFLLSMVLCSIIIYIYNKNDIIIL